MRGLESIIFMTRRNGWGPGVLTVPLFGSDIRLDPFVHVVHPTDSHSLNYRSAKALQTTSLAVDVQLATVSRDVDRSRDF